MSDDRDLAEAIYAELRTDDALDHAVERWLAHDMLPLRTRLALVLDAVTASALDRVLARRQREAARTGPWDAPCPTREETISALRERIAHLEIHRGRGPIAARIHELECMRDALRQLEEDDYPGSMLPPKRGQP